jgi:hypothetical protein
VGGRVAAHGRVEHARHLGVSGEVVPEARSVGVVERGLPGPHGVQQVAPRSPVRFVEQEQDGWPQGARDARAQQGCQLGQGEAARPDLIEHSDPGEEQQDSVEAWPMRPGRVSQLVDLPRAVGQEVGNAEPRRDVDRLRDPIAPNEGQKALSGLDTRDTVRVDSSVHWVGHSSEDRPPAPRPHEDLACHVRWHQSIFPKSPANGPGGPADHPCVRAPKGVPVTVADGSQEAGASVAMK